MQSREGDLTVSYALLSDDGSLVVVPGADLKQMRHERKVLNTNCSKASDQCKIVRVRFEIISGK